MKFLLKSNPIKGIMGNCNAGLGKKIVI